MKTAVVHAKKEGVSRLEIETLSKNAGMRCLAKKSGFKLERIRKKRIFKDGKYHDEATYYMLLQPEAHASQALMASLISLFCGILFCCLRRCQRDGD